MKLTNEIIEKLKTNTSAFGLMDQELQDAAEEIGHKEFDYRGESQWKIIGRDTETFYGSLTYRLHDSYLLPVVAEEWIECDIVSLGGLYWVHVGVLPQYHFAPEKRIQLDEVTSMVGFGGVQFQNQFDTHEWSMHTSAGIGNSGVTFTCIDSSDSTEEVATPIKARFKVKGGSE